MSCNHDNEGCNECCLCFRLFSDRTYSPENDGRLRLSKQAVVYKNSKTGRVDNIAASDLTGCFWRRVSLGHGVRLETKSGNAYKYDGFRESVR
ncbi:UNVERIFIED_CONTAM: hypothetical protein FKN15_045180 [Acipenser sinensis]